MDDMWRQESAKKICDSIRLPNANNCNMRNNNKNRTGKSKCTKQVRGLKYYLTNADSFLNKRDELLTLCNIYDPDTLMITETNPKNYTVPMQSSEFSMENYECYSTQKL